MKPINPRALLPHEILFGIFLVVTWLRLEAVVGAISKEAVFYLILISVNAALILYCRARETNARWRLRLLFYPVAMNLIYPHLKLAIPKLHPQPMDVLLQKLDALLIGKNLSLRLEAITCPALTEFFSLCYILFFPYLLFSMIYYFCEDLDLFSKFIAGLFSIYGVGFLGYSLVPALGPHLVMADQFTVPLTGWWITHWNAEVVRLGSNRVDVFPSLHCAISCFFLFFDRRHRPWRFKLYLVPCLGLWISTLYLRYHYFIDVLCGLALAALALWLSQRQPNKGES